MASTSSDNDWELCSLKDSESEETVLHKLDNEISWDDSSDSDKKIDAQVDKHVYEQPAKEFVIENEHKMIKSNSENNKTVSSGVEFSLSPEDEMNHSQSDQIFDSRTEKPPNKSSKINNQPHIHYDKDGEKVFIYDDESKNKNTTENTIKYSIGMNEERKDEKEVRTSFSTNQKKIENSQTRNGPIDQNIHTDNKSYEPVSNQKEGILATNERDIASHKGISNQLYEFAEVSSDSSMTLDSKNTLEVENSQTEVISYSSQDSPELEMQEDKESVFFQSEDMKDFIAESQSQDTIEYAFPDVLSIDVISEDQNSRPDVSDNIKTLTVQDSCLKQDTNTSVKDLEVLDGRNHLEDTNVAVQDQGFVDNTNEISYQEVNNGNSHLASQNPTSINYNRDYNSDSDSLSQIETQIEDLSSSTSSINDSFRDQYELKSSYLHNNSTTTEDNYLLSNNHKNLDSTFHENSADAKEDSDFGIYEDRKESDHENEFSQLSAQSYDGQTVRDQENYFEDLESDQNRIIRNESDFEISHLPHNDTIDSISTISAEQNAKLMNQVLDPADSNDIEISEHDNTPISELSYNDTSFRDQSESDISHVPEFIPSKSQKQPSSNLSSAVKANNLQDMNLYHERDSNFEESNDASSCNDYDVEQDISLYKNISDLNLQDSITIENEDIDSDDNELTFEENVEKISFSRKNSTVVDSLDFSGSQLDASQTSIDKLSKKLDFRDPPSEIHETDIEEGSDVFLDDNYKMSIIENNDSIQSNMIFDPDNRNPEPRTYTDKSVSNHDILNDHMFSTEIESDVNPIHRSKFDLIRENEDIGDNIVIHNTKPEERVINTQLEPYKEFQYGSEMSYSETGTSETYEFIDLPVLAVNNEDTKESPVQDHHTSEHFEEDLWVSTADQNMYKSPESFCLDTENFDLFSQTRNTESFDLFTGNSFSQKLSDDPKDDLNEQNETKNSECFSEDPELDVSFSLTENNKYEIETHLPLADPYSTNEPQECVTDMQNLSYDNQFHDSDTEGEFSIADMQTFHDSSNQKSKFSHINSSVEFRKKESENAIFSTKQNLERQKIGVSAPYDIVNSESEAKTQIDLEGLFTHNKPLINCESPKIAGHHQTHDIISFDQRNTQTYADKQPFEILPTRKNQQMTGKADNSRPIATYEDILEQKRLNLSKIDETSQKENRHDSIEIQRFPKQKTYAGLDDLSSLLPKQQHSRNPNEKLNDESSFLKYSNTVKTNIRTHSEPKVRNFTENVYKRHCFVGLSNTTVILAENNMLFFKHPLAIMRKFVAKSHDKSPFDTIHAIDIHNKPLKLEMLSGNERSLCIFTEFLSNPEQAIKKCKNENNFELLLLFSHRRESDISTNTVFDSTSPANIIVSDYLKTKLNVQGVFMLLLSLGFHKEALESIDYAQENISSYYLYLRGGFSHLLPYFLANTLHKSQTKALVFFKDICKTYEKLSSYHFMLTCLGISSLEDTILKHPDDDFKRLYCLQQLKIAEISQNVDLERLYKKYKKYLGDHKKVFAKKFTKESFWVKNLKNAVDKSLSKMMGFETDFKLEEKNLDQKKEIGDHSLPKVAESSSIGIIQPITNCESAKANISVSDLTKNSTTHNKVEHTTYKDQKIKNYGYYSSTDHSNAFQIEESIGDWEENKNEILSDINAVDPTNTNSTIIIAENTSLNNDFDFSKVNRPAIDTSHSSFKAYLHEKSAEYSVEDLHHISKECVTIKANENSGFQVNTFLQKNSNAVQKSRLDLTESSESCEDDESECQNSELQPDNALESPTIPNINDQEEIDEKIKISKKTKKSSYKNSSQSSTEKYSIEANPEANDLLKKSIYPNSPHALSTANLSRKDGNFYENKAMAQSFADFFDQDQKTTIIDSSSAIANMFDEPEEDKKPKEKKEEKKSESKIFGLFGLFSRKKRPAFDVESDANFVFDKTTKKWINVSEKKDTKKAAQIFKHKEIGMPSLKATREFKSTSNLLSGRYAGIKHSQVNLHLPLDKKPENR